MKNNDYPLVKNAQNNFFDSLIDDNNLLIIAGPCSVESYDTLLVMAKKLQKLGISYMRAGAFKPRTSCYDFQGLKDEGMDILIKVKKLTGIKIVTEIPSVEILNKYQNFELLKRVGEINKPVILKRGFGNTIDEWLHAAEYIMKEGNNHIILCERGIKTFENATRNTLDISSIPVVKHLTKLPIIVDPSHAAGRRDLIESLSLASIAAGADGLLIETHLTPSESISDSEQAIDFDDLEKILKKIKKVALYQFIYLFGECCNLSCRLFIKIFFCNTFKQFIAIFKPI